MGTMVTDGHLGGYVEGGDEATYFPHMWHWLVRDLGVRTVLDIGCGEGHALNQFADLLENERSVVGVDGVPQDHPRIVAHDFTKGAWRPLLSSIGGTWLGSGFDLVWCCEFVEHVEAQHMPHFLEAFKLGRRLLMTHADPGQQGYHHVNCQPRDYWIGALAAAGFELDEGLTLQTRALSRLNTSPWNHYARSGLAFKNVRFAA